MINYPTLKKVEDYKKNKNDFRANQGMGLEEMINKTNAYYLNNNIAFVNKRPTSI